MQRRGSLGNTRARTPGVAAYGGDTQADMFGAGTTRQFVEFHPSMSLEHPAFALDFLPPPAPLNLVESVAASSTPAASNLTLREVLTARSSVWTRVQEAVRRLERLRGHEGDVRALQKLLELHSLCSLRESQQRAIHLSLLEERALRGDTCGSQPPPDATPHDQLQLELSEFDAHLDSPPQSPPPPPPPPMYQPPGPEIVDMEALDLFALSEHSLEALGLSTGWSDSLSHRLALG